MPNAKYLIVFVAAVFFITLFAEFSLLALADNAIPPAIPCSPGLPCITEKTQELGGQSIRDYITEKFAVSFLKSFLGLAAITAVVFIIVGGLQMHLAVGNEEDIKKAQKTVLWAALGLVVCILAVAIVQIISTLSKTFT